MSLSNTQIADTLASLDSNWFSDERNFYGETYRNEETGLFHIGEETYEEEDEIPTDKLEPCCYTDMRILHDGVKQLIAQNEELKKEVETLKETAHTNFQRFDSLMEQYNVVVGTSNKYAEEVVELKEENKKLKEQNEDNLASLNFYTEQCAELKDERKKLKETIQHCEGVMESDEDLEERLKAQHQIDMEEIMPLVTQVEEYEEMTEALAQYFSKIDQNACDVFNKLLPMWYGGDRAEIE